MLENGIVSFGRIPDPDASKPDDWWVMAHRHAQLHTYIQAHIRPSLNTECMHSLPPAGGVLCQFNASQNFS